jgi:flagellar basal body-associated protein FliL
MPKRNIKSFKFVKSVLLMLCVVIVITVITVGLVILWSKKSKESTPKRNESMPEEKHFESILSLEISIFFVYRFCF